MLFHASTLILIASSLTYTSARAVDVDVISVLQKRSYSIKSSASSFAGATSVQSLLPTRSTPNTFFPDSKAVGYPGPTKNGAEPFAAETGISFAKNTDIYPLAVPKPYSSEKIVKLTASSNKSSNKKVEPFLMQNYWGAYTPAYSVDSEVYGLKGASPLAPDTCEIKEVHYTYRHGARGPTSQTELVGKFGMKVAAAAKTGFSASGPLEFLNTWEYKLNEGLLTAFGRKQNFDLGVNARILYGHLLDNFTGVPVFTTESNSRMVSTAQNFAAGLFGIPAEDQYNLVISVEAQGFNNTGASYETCLNADTATDSQGAVASAAFANIAFNKTAARLSEFVTGLKFVNGSEVVGLLELCAYETVALGSSPFCSLFTEEEFRDLEYFFDLNFYYGWSFGSPIAAAAGLGYLQEFVARLTKTPINLYNSTTNSTIDANRITFPLDQPLYADATHEVIALALMTALNLTSLASSGPLPLTHRPKEYTFVASRIVPFGLTLVAQVLDCDGKNKIRFLVNDAVIPLTYKGCDRKQKDGLCDLDTVISALYQRIEEIDFERDCFGNYTVPAGKDLNGRAPPK